MIALRNVTLLQMWCMQSRGGSLHGRRRTMCKFERKEACVFTVNLSARGPES